MRVRRSDILILSDCILQLSFAITRAVLRYRVVPASLPTIDRSLDPTKLHRSLFRDSYKLLYFPGGYYTTHNIVIVVAMMTFIDIVNFDCNPHFYS